MAPAGHLLRSLEWLFHQLDTNVSHLFAEGHGGAKSPPGWPEQLRLLDISHLVTKTRSHCATQSMLLSWDPIGQRYTRSEYRALAAISVVSLEAGRRIYIGRHVTV